MVRTPEAQTFRGAKVDPQRGIFADADRIREAASGAGSLGEIMSRLGLRPSGARYAQLRASMTNHGIEYPARDRVLNGKSVLCDRAAVARAVRGSRSQKEALEALGLSLAGKNYARLAVSCGVFGLPAPPKWGVRGAADEAQQAEAERRRQRWLVLHDEQAVRASVCGAPSWSVAAQRLWMVSDTRDREALRVRCAELGLSLDPRTKRGILNDREAVAAAVQDARSVIEALTALKLAASSHYRLVRACEEYGLRVPRADKSTMANIGHERAKAEYRWGKPEDVLKRDPAISQRRVRNMVLRYKLIPYICALCGSLPTWGGKPLTLILDHENGDPVDHCKENLRFVCPNCESQLPTHGPRNGKARAA
jgi:hypothetical protein